MALLETWQVISIAILGIVVCLLAVLMLLAICMYMRKRQFLCFKKAKKKQKREDEEILYNYDESNAVPRRRKKINEKLGEHRKFSDPFASRFSDPLQMEFQEGKEYDTNLWKNPLFDVRGARMKDAAITIQAWWRMIRDRMRFLETREAAYIIQSAWRGVRVRKNLSQYKKEKQEREQIRKKAPGYIKKKGTLSALKFYDVKGFGFAEVQHLYGIETMRFAAEQLKGLYEGKGKMRLKLFISVKGARLYEPATMRHFATVKMSTISFCSLDPKNKKLFAFINKKKKRNFCHVFQCHEGDAQKMVETMAEAFEVTFKLLEQEKKRKENERLVEKRKETLRQSTHDLDIEVEQMMKIAESASIGTPSMSQKGLDSPGRRTPSPKSSSQRMLNGSNDYPEMIKRGHTNTSSPLLITNKAPNQRLYANQSHFTSHDSGSDISSETNEFEARQRASSYL